MRAITLELLTEIKKHYQLDWYGTQLAKSKEVIDCGSRRSQDRSVPEMPFGLAGAEEM